MTDQVAVSVENVSKKFKKSSAPAKTLKERVISWGGGPAKEFAALTDVNFEVKVGETLGILGHNGSGKSTLLKTMAGTLRPTSGRVRVRGRLAALLELGAGFHPDLTGKENIYLNGSVLGFSASQVDEIFDEIVAFSELEEFIHTQVKHYSSGMYARLGFAVAINLQPDVMLVDEVLSVGDEAFQNKCINKIEEFRAMGKTLILVTHSPDQAVALCDRVVVLDHGKVISKGDPIQAVEIYRKSIHPEGYEIHLDRAVNGEVQIKDLEVNGPDGHGHISPDKDIGFRCLISSSVPTEAHVEVLVTTSTGAELMKLSSATLMETPPVLSSDGQWFSFTAAGIPVFPGRYLASIRVTSPDGKDTLASANEMAEFLVDHVGPTTGTVWVPASCRIEKA